MSQLLGWLGRDRENFSMEQRILPSYNYSQQEANRANKRKKINFEGKNKGSSKGVKIKKWNSML